MKSPYHDIGMPIGLSLELSYNIDAMNVFASMSKQEKERLISRAKGAKSKEEIKSIVDALTHIELS